MKSKTQTWKSIKDIPENKRVLLKYDLNDCPHKNHFKNLTNVRIGKKVHGIFITDGNGLVVELWMSLSNPILWTEIPE